MGKRRRTIRYTTLWLLALYNGFSKARTDKTQRKELIMLAVFAIPAAVVAIIAYAGVELIATMNAYGKIKEDVA